MAKELKRHPRERTRPPITAVNLVDLRLQIPMMKGDINRPKDMDNAPNDAVKEGEREHFIRYIIFSTSVFHCWSKKKQPSVKIIISTILL